MVYDYGSHYMAQSKASFWTRPRNAALSREINNYSLARLNATHGLQSKSKAEAVRHILYDSGFSYDGPLPAGALEGDPQFASYYNTSNSITRYGNTMVYLEQHVKSLGFDCTGHRYKNLYLQALAGNKKAREALDAAFGDNFPSHPKEAWYAIEHIMHCVYDDYLKQYGCPDRLCNHPMYPAIAPPLPNPVKLRDFILRARKTRDISTLSWMLGRVTKLQELSAENAEYLVQSILNRFGFTPAEIAVMHCIVSEQEQKGKRSATKGLMSKAEAPHESGSFVFGCIVLSGSFALVFAVLYLVARMMKSCGTVGIIIGAGVLFAVLGFLIVLCRVYRGKKGRPP